MVRLLSDHKKDHDEPDRDRPFCAEASAEAFFRAVSIAPGGVKVKQPPEKTPAAAAQR